MHTKQAKAKFLLVAEDKARNTTYLARAVYIHS